MERRALVRCSYRHYHSIRFDSIHQLYKLLSRRSSHGVSGWFVLVTNIFSFAALLNVFLLQFEAFHCCQSLVLLRARCTIHHIRSAIDS